MESVRHVGSLWEAERQLASLYTEYHNKHGMVHGQFGVTPFVINLFLVAVGQTGRDRRQEARSKRHLEIDAQNVTLAGCCKTLFFTGTHSHITRA